MSICIAIHIAQTKIGDTLYTFAKRHSGIGDIDAFLKQLRHENFRHLPNIHGIDASGYDDHDLLPSHIALIVPDSISNNPYCPVINKSPFEGRQVVNTINREPGPRRQELHTILNSGYDLSYLSALSMFVEKIEQAASSILTPSHIAGFALGVTEKTTDHLRKRANEFVQTLKEVDDKLKAFKNSAPEENAAAKAEFIAAHTAMNEQFHKEIIDFRNSRPRMKKGYFLQDPDRAINLAMSRKLGFSMADTKEMEAIVRLSKRAKYIGRTFIAVEILADAASVIGTFLEGRDWQKELFEDVSGYAGGYIFGTIAAFLLSFTTASLLIIIPTVALASIEGSELFKKTPTLSFGEI